MQNLSSNFMLNFKARWPRLLFLTCLMVFGLSSRAAMENEDPSFIPDLTSPLIAWENEFQAQLSDNELLNEKRYRDLLEKIRDYLFTQGVSTQIEIAYAKLEEGVDPGRAWLRILPGEGSSLNRLAAILAENGFSLQYIDRLGIVRQAAESRPKLLYIKSTINRWYLNARALSNIENFLKLGMVNYGIAVAQRHNLDPIAAAGLYDFVLNYQNFQNLTWDHAAKLPYLAIMVHPAQQIYVPYHSLTTTGRNPESKFVSVDHFRGIKSLSILAQQLLADLKHHQPFGQKNVAKLGHIFFPLLESIKWRVLDLQVIAHTMIERPWDVYYTKNERDPGYMRAYINPQPGSHAFAYMLDFPWPGPKLGNGNTFPLINRPEFQMFYRYNANIFYRLNAIAHFAANFTHLDPVKQAKFLKRLIRLDQVPNKLAEEIKDDLWDINQLRDYLASTQDLLLYEIKQGEIRKAKHAAKLAAKRDFCATQVTPPTNEQSK